MKIDNESLFAENLLTTLDFTECDVYLSHKLSSSNPGENLIMRPLHRHDFHKHYTTLMSQLTQIGEITEEMFLRRFDQMKQCGDMYYIFVIEDVSINRLVGSGSFIVEKHLTPNLSIIKHGRIEDIVVSSTHRKKQLGKLILETITLLAKKLECDRMSLECKDPLVKFYTQFNYHPKYEEKYLCNRGALSKL